MLQSITLVFVERTIVIIRAFVGQYSNCVSPPLPTPPHTRTTNPKLVTTATFTPNITPQVRHGNHPVHERGHTVVMNWNRQTLSVLQQVSHAWCYVDQGSNYLDHKLFIDILYYVRVNVL